MPSTSENPRRPCPAGLDDRCRDDNGVIRRKRSDTLVATLRAEYGDDFAKGFRGDATLEAVLRETDSESLSDYLRRRPAPGRPATARDTARILGVPASRADQLIRNVSGEIRRKRSDMLVGAVRHEHDADFAEGFRRDATAGMLRHRDGLGSSTRLLATRKRANGTNAKATATKTKAKTKASVSEAHR
jgi:hypothetical protein